MRSSSRAAAAAGCSRSTRRTCSTPRACGGASSPSSRAEYPDVELRHGLVDSVAMQLVMDPQLVRHARDGEHLRRHPLRRRRRRHRRARARVLGEPRRRRPGIFEPVHGSAPGHRRHRRLRTRPRCCARSALLLEHGLGEPALARALEAAVALALDERPTPDLGGSATTSEFGTAVVAALARGGRGVTPRRLPRARRAATAPPRPPLLAPPGAGDRAARELHGGRRGDGRRRGRRSASCRSRTRSTARSARRTTCSTRRRVSIVSEVTLPIVHCLAAKTPLRLDEVRTLRSHPVAFDQCRDLIHSLGVKCIPSSSTSDAAREVAESRRPGRGRDLEPRGRRSLRPDA